MGRGLNWVLTSLEHLVGVLGESELLDLLLAGALDDLVDVDALEVDALGVDLANFDDVVGLDDGVLGVLGHGLVEVVHGLAELAVTELVGLVDLNQGVVTENRFFQDVFLSVEFAFFLGGVLDSDATVLVVTNGEFTRLHYTTG